jgi:23S rRNA (uracil1939-C5)-methyltransferase
MSGRTSIERAVTIERLGDLGDGIAETEQGRLHIPFAAPGDVANVAITAKDSARILDLLTAGPDRVTPPCVHFGRCGGCALQHLAPAFTATWKRARIIAALGRVGLGNAPVGETIAIPPNTRRRATLAASRQRDRVLLGFAERGSHRIVDLADCRILHPDLVALIPLLRIALRTLLNDRETADIALTRTGTGVDFTLIRVRPLTLIDRETLAGLAVKLDFARITWRATIRKPAEPVAVARTPLIRLGVYSVSPPSGSFLQPSVEGEAALTSLVLDALQGVDGPVADLFSGVGTFALPMVANNAVTAFDADADAIAALKAAARGAGLIAKQRDLFREPLTPVELNEFRAAVIDPPRAGAAAQATEMANSGIEVIASVSCNPITFARDAAILTAGGYRLTQVTPVDQFLWSPHTELVGVLRRA